MEIKFNSKKTQSDPKDEQKFRKHLEALFVAIAFAIFLTGLFFVIGSLITYITTAAGGIAWFGWVGGLVVTSYLLYSGLISDTFSFCITSAKRIANAIADGYYEEETTTVETPQTST